MTAYLKPRSTAKSTASGIDSTELLLQSSAHPKLDLIGREADDDADAQVKHYVAVVDPEQKTCEFVPVRRVTVRGGVRKAKRLEKGSDDGEDEVEDGTAVCFQNSTFFSMICGIGLNEIDNPPRTTHRVNQHLRHQSRAQGRTIRR